jgi:tetratricopeptide (TPR) repeat protein
VKLKEYRNAEKIFLRSYAIDANTNAKNSLGELYYYLKEYDKSLYYYNQIYPQAPTHLYNLSFTYLAMQQFRRGYELYENRLASNDINPQTKLQERVNIPILPYWDGVLPCKKLLVVYEQGLGDNIQHYRFMIELCKKHPQLKIEYFCKDTVSKVFVEYDRLKIVDKVELLKPNGEKNYDYYCYIMSLPKMVGVEKIYPNRVQYLKTNENDIPYYLVNDIVSRMANINITFNNNNVFTKTSTAALRQTSAGSIPVTAFCFATCGPTQQFLPFVFRTSYIINFTGPGSGSCIVTDVTANGDVPHPINNTTVPASMAAPTAFTSDIKLDFLC